MKPIEQWTEEAFRKFVASRDKESARFERLARQLEESRRCLSRYNEMILAYQSTHNGN